MSRIHAFFIYLFLGAFLQSPIAYGAIYGVDNRIFTTQLRHVEAAKASLAVGSIGILSEQKSCTKTKCTSNLSATLSDRVGVSRRDGGFSRLCEGEKFENSPTLGYGTGFLISSQYIMTAGHITELDLASNLFITFDHVGEKGAANEFEVYRFEEIVLLGRRITETERFDYAIVKLDRPVKYRTPLTLKGLPANTYDTRLAEVGHPNGLPKIFTGGGSILRKNGKSIFYTNLDAMSGNSGSPVFDTSDWSVIGIHVDGPNDYEIMNGCKRVYVCHLPNCRKGDLEDLPGGEAVTDMGFLLNQMTTEKISIEGLKTKSIYSSK